MSPTARVGLPWAQFLPYQYEVSTGSGGVGDPLIIETYEVDETLQPQLVRWLWYMANASGSDTRDAVGTGTVTYYSSDHEKTEDYVWNGATHLDPAGANVLTQFGGYELRYLSVDDYHVEDHNRARELIYDYGYSNATNAVLDPPVDATRQKTGFNLHTEEKWDEFHEYATVEADFATDIVTTMKGGSKVERSLNAIDPFLLDVKTTVWDGGTLTPTGWVQGEVVTTSTEPGPWPGAPMPPMAMP